MPEQELNLLKFASVHVAQLRAGSAQIMRGDVLEFNTTGTIPNNVPNHIFRNPPTPSCSGRLTGLKTRPSVTFAAAIHLSTAVFTHTGMGTVRICPPFPIKSTIAQWP